MALHVTELRAPTAAAEPVLHAPLSTAPPGALQPPVASPLVSKKLASHVIKLHAETAAAEHVLHTPLSTAPQGASQPSAASPMVSKKLALHVTELHASTAAAEHVLPRTPRACAWLLPAVVWGKLPPASASLAALAWAMAGLRGQNRSSPRSPNSARGCFSLATHNC